MWCEDSLTICKSASYSTSQTRQNHDCWYSLSWSPTFLSLIMYFKWQLLAMVPNRLAHPLENLLVFKYFIWAFSTMSCPHPCLLSPIIPTPKLRAVPALAGSSCEMKSSSGKTQSSIAKMLCWRKLFGRAIPLLCCCEKGSYLTGIKGFQSKWFSPFPTKRGALTKHCLGTAHAVGPSKLWYSTLASEHLSLRLCCLGSNRVSYNFLKFLNLEMSLLKMHLDAGLANN